MSLFPDDAVEPLERTGKWHGREVSYFSGRWEQLEKLVPRFELGKFAAEPNAAANPYMQTVIRLPRSKVEQRIPVGVVSNTYSLAQHHEVVDRCFAGIRLAGVEPRDQRCEVGLTELGEWMTLSVYFPERFRFARSEDDWMDLRLVCSNSVDGSSKLVIIFGWLRFVCSNGMVIGETKLEHREAHNHHLDLASIPDMICDAMSQVKKDLTRLEKWSQTPLGIDQLVPWVNGPVTKAWGKRAASRVYHICRDGHDIEFEDAFAPGEATEKPVRWLEPVPGSTAPADTMFDVSQAMSWVATRRNDVEERFKWQADVPRLISELAECGRGN